MDPTQENVIYLTSSIEENTDNNSEAKSLLSKSLSATKFQVPINLDSRLELEFKESCTMQIGAVAKFMDDLDEEWVINEEVEGPTLEQVSFLVEGPKS